MSEHDDAILHGWTKGSFSAAGFTRDTYRRGSGPGVVIIHEVPGITPAVTRFANDVVDAGFTVVMPSLLGTPGREVSVGYAMRSFTRMCVAREFTSWARNTTSPVVAYLRAVARALHNELGGPGVGAIGMCFSGGFALGMMVDRGLVGPVLSQPAMPLIGITKARGADVNLSPDDALVVAQRAADGCQVLGLKFSEDRLVGTRFDTLRTLLGDQFLAVEVPSRRRTDHSVLTEHRDEASVQRVIQFLRDALVVTDAAPEQV